MTINNFPEDMFQVTSYHHQTEIPAGWWTQWVDYSHEAHEYCLENYAIFYFIDLEFFLGET